jgi:hypothetical protein
VPHPNDSQDVVIPVLNEVIVQGDPAQARETAAEPADGFGSEPDEGAFVEDESTAPLDLPMSDAIAAPIPTPTPARAEARPVQPAAVASVASATAASAAASAPAASAASAPVAGPGITDYDANLIAERLRGRFASYLTGEGRALIESRCRDAFQEHTSRLVSQITREVSMALESELTGWVREAIREELKHRGG